MPIVADSGYVRRVAFDTVLYMLLALGLNVVVGWGGLLDLGYVAFYGIGAYTYALLSSPGSASTCRRSSRSRSSSCRRRRGLPRGAAVAAAGRRLPGDRDAVLPADIPDRRDERRPDRSATTSPAAPTASSTSTRCTCSATRSAVQHEGVFAVGYLYVALAVLRGRLRRAALRQPVAHGTRLALAARGSARGRGDGHAGQPAQADGLQLRRGRRGAHGHAVRVAERQRLPAHVLVPAR